ncbi:hypothetical protein [uncultured Brachyspira sp.]|uniref:hypothetical protein n=1 Tax=uncultured Brachyspira sp. TaxID=221953 RepID=UPI0026162383|nr:hypothetical protein [uncultured Brachyspira sp.]
MNKREIINKIKNELNNIDRDAFNEKVRALSPLAKNNNLIIVSADSEDFILFDGVIERKKYCPMPVKLYINTTDYERFKLVFSRLDLDNIYYPDDIEKLNSLQEFADNNFIAIKVSFNKKEWDFKLDLPEGMKIDYDTFNVLEDREVFSKGLIIDLESFKKAEAE